jgi:hypothetical protein
MTYLILTVGTGTAGPHSNLTEGLRRTIKLLEADKFWLIPSTSEDSILVADYVRKDLPQFQPLSPDQPYRCIQNPDDLESCRHTVREAIRAARASLGYSDRLFINPTSGTKQMSAGATLAALDEGIGDIIFTTGQRADGVVMTGTERITTFDPSDFFLERDTRTAQDLIKACAYRGAARVLRPHETRNPKLVAQATMIACWRDFDFIGAAAAAARFSNAWKRELTRRDQCLEKRQSCPEIIADLIAFALNAKRVFEAREMMTLSYQALEYASRDVLIRQGLVPNERGSYDKSVIDAAKIPPESKDFLLAQNIEKDRVELGLMRCLKILEQMDHPLGTEILSNHDFRLRLYSRNEHVHALSAADFDAAQGLLDSTCNFLRSAGLLDKPTPIPFQLDR